MKSLFSVIVFFLPASPLFAELKLPAVFNDHMVLQQKQPIPVWGWAHAGDEVLVQFKGQEKSVKAGGDGRWKVRLDAVDASAEPALFTVREGDAGLPSVTFLSVRSGCARSVEHGLVHVTLKRCEAGNRCSELPKYPTVQSCP